jgi:DNA polymerase elongation subunit (family B)
MTKRKLNSQNQNFYSNVFLSGEKIFYIGYENGERVQYRETFSPVLYTRCNEKTEYKTLEGHYAKEKKFETVRAARDFVDEYKFVDNVKVYGNDRFLYQYISSKFPQEQMSYDSSQLRIYTVDIETTSENGFPNVAETSEEILCLSVKDFTTKKIITWGTREFTPKDTEYRVFWKEEDMLKDFVSWWVENTPDIVTGWNVKLFDIPYICRRIDRVLSTKYMRSLSPWNKVFEKEVEIKGRNHIYYDIIGLSVLDYLDLYQKFTYKAQESYRLDYIAQVELGQQKLDHSEYDTFKQFYTNNWQKFVEYNIHDVELVDRLEDKMKLIELALTMAYDAKVNYEDVYSQVRTWDSIIYNFLKTKGIVIPPIERSDKNTQYAGAYVKEPKPGLYKWVVNFDLNSLYPHLIMQYNISPETLMPNRHSSATVDRILNKEIDFSDLDNTTVCANGALYDTTQRGFLPELMQKYYDERVIFKKKMIKAKQEYEKDPSVELEKEITRCNNIQMAKKISLNSAYGAIGNQYFRYFKVINAEAITLSGQVSIRWIENKMNEYLNKVLKTEGEDYVVASDTDSIYLNLGPLVDKFFSDRSSDKTKIVSILDKICQDKLEPYIDTCYQELATYVSAYDQKMVMKRENIADKGIWTAKKRYILNVWDSEGVRYETAKLKMMGIEAIKSSTPAPCRQMIKDALDIIMTKENEDLITFIDDFRTKFYSMPPEEIAFPRSVNGLTKWSDPVTLYKKSCPIHVRGALLYNSQLRSNKLVHKYPIIQEGEKIKYVYLKEPNVLGQNVMSFISDFPEEIPKVRNQIDYGTQFEKSFIRPLKNILDVIGWKTKKESNLEFLFV